MAGYHTALLASQLGDHARAATAMRRFGAKFRIAPGVWDHPAVTAPPGWAPPWPLVSTPAPVRLRAKVVPPQLGAVLRRAFAPGAAYWRENDYGQRGYFSWYATINP